MGCFFSTPEHHAAAAAKREAGGAAKGKAKRMVGSPPSSSAGDAGGGIIIMGSSAAFKKKLDPKDFQCVNLTGQTVVKRPGSINGQQFVVMGCEDCDSWVCDHCEMVTIDRSRNCRIFIGPCESSIFVRNCANVKLVAACRQFRTRDCEDLDVLMHCVSQPTIETSKRVRFGCFQFFYFALGAQFEKARLPVFNNRWSEVYNYKPMHGGYELLTGPAAEPSAFLKPLHEHADFVTADESDHWRAQSPVPRTDGPAAAGADTTVVICAPEAGIDGALDLIRALTVRPRAAPRAPSSARARAAHADAAAADAGRGRAATRAHDPVRARHQLAAAAPLGVRVCAGQRRGARRRAQRRGRRRAAGRGRGQRGERGGAARRVQRRARQDAGLGVDRRARRRGDGGPVVCQRGRRQLDGAVAGAGAALVVARRAI
jgi:protein XRP2